jgi:hypothetical protein
LSSIILNYSFNPIQGIIIDCLQLSGYAIAETIIGMPSIKKEIIIKDNNSFISYNPSLVGDPGIEPGVRLREGVTVPCHTLRPVALLYLVEVGGFEPPQRR